MLRLPALVFLLLLGQYRDAPVAVTPPEAEPIEQIVEASPPEVITPAVPEPEGTRVYIIQAVVTACSPYDSQADKEYYAAYGYEGSTYGIAANTAWLPRGTEIRVPGYMPVSYPNKYWRVDSAGGPIIRRAARRGVLQIDVKFATRASVMRWGRQVLDIAVVLPDNASAAQHQRLARIAQDIFYLPIEEN